MALPMSTWLIRIGIDKTLARLKEKGKPYHLKGQSDNSKNNKTLEIPDGKQLNPQDKMIRDEQNIF